MSSALRPDSIAKIAGFWGALGRGRTGTYRVSVPLTAVQTAVISGKPPVLVGRRTTGAAGDQNPFEAKTWHLQDLLGTD